MYFLKKKNMVLIVFSVNTIKLQLFLNNNCNFYILLLESNKFKDTSIIFTCLVPSMGAYFS